MVQPDSGEMKATKEGYVMLAKKTKNRMNVAQFRIGDLAQELKIKKFVIRFWEKEFNLTAHRSDGGQRFYSQDDFDVFQRIKTLLYEEGFTIPGARKQLELERKQVKAPEKSVGEQTAVLSEQFLGAYKDQFADSMLYKDLQVLKNDLQKLRDLLSSVGEK